MKYNKKQLSFLFIINWIILLCAYSPMLFTHFSIDSYLINESIDVRQPLASGRLVFWLFYLLCDLVQLNPVKYQIVFVLCLIITSAFVLTMLVKMFYNKLYTKFNIYTLVLCEMVFLIGFLNVFYLEFFLYTEVCLVYSLALLFMLLAVNESKKNNVHFLFAATALFLSLNCYEALFPVFIMISILELLIETDFKCSIYSIKQVTKFLLIAAIAAVMKIFELKILASWHVSRSDFIGENIVDLVLHNLIEIFIMQKELWLTAFSFLPFGVCTFVGVVLLILLVRGFRKLKLNGIDIVYTIVLCLGCYFCIFVLKVLNASVWLAPRTIVGFFFFISTISIAAIYLNKFSIRESKFLMLVLGLFLIVNFIQIQDISQNHYKVMACDYYEAMEINRYIEKYEKSTGIDVNKIATKKDSQPTWTYPNIEYSRFDTNVRVMVVDWSNVQCINYWTNSSYEKVPFPDEMYIQGCNWNELNLKEQMQFIDDTAYLIIY